MKKPIKLLASSLLVAPLVVCGLLEIGLTMDRVDFSVAYGTTTGDEEVTGDWAGLKNFAKNANKGDIYTLTSDIVTSELDNRVVVDGKTITIDLAGHTIKKTASDKYYKNGHIFEIQGESNFTLIDSVGGGSLQNGCANNGGALNIHEGSTATIENVIFSNNRADIDGGAIYNHGHLIMKNSTISHNTTKKSGGGIYNDGDGWFELTNVDISYNTSQDDGGGIKTKLGKDSKMTGCNIHHNESKKYDGGGLVLNDDDHKLRLYNTTIAYNKCEDSGGGIRVWDGNIELYGCDISYNEAGHTGGGVYNGDNFKILDDEGETTISHNKAGHDGGGIWTKGKTELQGVNIIYNQAKKGGGGLYVNNDETHFYSGTVKYNQALEHYGGGIYLYDASLNLADVEITHNKCIGFGGGVFVHPKADHFRISGKPVIYGNAAGRGDGVYITDIDSIVVKGKLQEGAKIAFVLVYGHDDWLTHYKKFKDEDVFGKLTDGYKDFNGEDDPNKYFVSSMGYKIVLKDGEVKPVNEKISTEPVVPVLPSDSFIPWNEQVELNEYNLDGNNWLSGVSGERRLNEINTPVSHDSSMRDVSASTKCIGTSTYGYEYAVTQRAHIYEQLQQGIRGLDLRIANKRVNKKGHASGDQKDDGKNLFMCHGKTSAGGTHYALDPETGYPLNFKTVVGWVQDFLTEHPTEYVLFDFGAECQHDSDKAITFMRLEKILREMTDPSYERYLNPATGEPFFYLEDGDFTKPYSDWPKLKDVRGKIVLRTKDADKYDVKIGGIKDTHFNHTYVEIKNETSYNVSTVVKIRDLKKFGKEQVGKRDLPKDASRLIDADSSKPIFMKAYLNVVDGGLTGIPSDTPLNHSDKVIPETIGPGKVFDPEYRGKFVGWVSGDGFSGFTNSCIYSTNFCDDFDYKTITVKSNQADIPDQTFKLLKGSEFTIPGYIYNNVAQGGDRGYFAHWEINGTSYETGAKYTLEDNITVNAIWGETPEYTTYVRAIFKDAGNKDTLRSALESFKIRVNDVNEYDMRLINGWYRALPIEVNDNKLVPLWDKASDNTDTDGKYRYTISGSNAQGWLITFIHTPADKVDLNSFVSFLDIGNSSVTGSPRPDDIKYQLKRYYYGEETVIGEHVYTVNGAGSSVMAQYTFENVNKYYNGEEAYYALDIDSSYSITPSTADLSKYDNVLNGTMVSYTLQGIMTLGADVVWDNIPAEERPTNLTFKLTDTTSLKELTDHLNPQESEENVSSYYYSVVKDGDDEQGDPYIDLAHYKLEAVESVEGVNFIIYKNNGMFFVVATKNTSLTETAYIMGLIDNIGTVTKDSGDAIKKARYFYDTLTEDEAKSITNYQTLLDAEEDYQNIRFGSVIATYTSIAVLKNIQYDETSKALIRHARELYENLLEEDKYCIPNLDDLVAAEETYMELEREYQRRMFDVNEVIEDINAIGEVNLDSDTLSKLSEARSCYNVLKDDDKPLVTNYNVLLHAEADFYAKYFLSTTDFVENSRNRLDELALKWPLLNAMWNRLDPETKAILAAGESSDTVKAFYNRYTYIMNHFSDTLQAFEGGPTFSPLTTNYPLVIGVICGIFGGATLISAGVLVIIHVRDKKKKVINK